VNKDVQKSFNFINEFACYKQKCKLAPFNLADPVVVYSDCCRGSRSLIYSAAVSCPNYS